MATLQELNGRLAQKQSEWMDIWNGKPERNFTDEERDRLKALMAEMDDLGTKRDEAQTLETKAQDVQRQMQADRQPATSAPLFASDTSAQSAVDDSVADFGLLYTSSQAFKRLKAWGPSIADTIGSERFAVRGYMADAGMEPELVQAAKSRGLKGLKLGGEKAVVMTGLTLPRSERLGMQRPASIQQPTIADLIPESVTDQQALSFFVEGANTNAAAPVAEGGAAPESSIAGFTEVEERVRWIPNGIPVTEQTLRSEPLMRGYINDTLLLNVRTTEENQLILGNGTAPNLRGIFGGGATPRAFQTQAKGTDNNFDAIAKAMTLVRLSNLTRSYQPDAVIMHPNDVQILRLTRDANGNYIYGGPAAADGGVPRVWGVRIVESTTATPAGTARVGAFGTAARIFRFWEQGVTVFSEHSDLAARRMLFVRADTALALAVFQENAFVNVTGIA